MNTFLKNQGRKLLEMTNINRHMTIVEIDNGDWVVLKTWNRKAVLGQYRDPQEAFAMLLASKALAHFKGLVITVERMNGDEGEEQV